MIAPPILRLYQPVDRRRPRDKRPRYIGAQGNPPAHIPHDLEDMTLDELWDRQRPTPQVTIEAIMHSVRERGLGALSEPATIDRLSRCDAAARAQINHRIDQLIERGGLLR